MAWVKTLDIQLPDGSTQKVPVLDNYIRDNLEGLRERLNTDLVLPLTGTEISDLDCGKHRKVTFYGVLAVKPTLQAGECALYIKTVSGKSELFFENEDGTEKQLTSLATLNITASDIPADTINQTHIELANNTYLIASNAAGDGDVTLIKANTLDEPVLGVGAKTYSTAAPISDAHVVNRKFVIDQLAVKGTFASGTTVFNTYCTAGSVWQDLDLSAQVGANVAMVYLEVTSSGGNFVAVKPKGYGSTTFANHYSSAPLGASMTQVGSGKYGYLVCMTNSSGVLQIGAQYGGSAGYAFTVKLIGYFK